MSKVDKIVSFLNLKPHPAEGCYFIETYRSDEKIKKGALPDRYTTDRSISTAIYYLLTKKTFSPMHKLATDEVFHFYMGGPVQLLMLYPDGEGKIVTLGTDIFAGMKPQVVVPKGVWQGSKLLEGSDFALLGTTMSPGFDMADYEPGDREELVKHYPNFKELIVALTML